MLGSLANDPCPVEIAIRAAADRNRREHARHAVAAVGRDRGCSIRRIAASGLPAASASSRTRPCMVDGSCQPSSVRNVGAKSTFAARRVARVTPRLDRARRQSACCGCPTGSSCHARPCRERSSRASRARSRRRSSPARTGSAPIAIVAPARGVERQRAGHAAVKRPGRAARVKIAPTPGVRCSARTIATTCRSIAVAHVDRAAARRRCAASRRAACRQTASASRQIDAAGVRGETVVRRDPDVVAVEQAGALRARPRCGRSPRRRA